jgi:prepilin-type N-terminal cleavage/methylation domain-containing protein
VVVFPNPLIIKILPHSFEEQTMKSPLTFGEGESGFTLLELLIIIVVLSILAGIAIPAFSAWLPEYRLRNAARDIYSTLQRAKSGAANANETWGVFFDNSVSPGRYSTWSFGPNRKWDNGGGDDVPQGRRVELSEYEGVNYGNGSAAENMQGEAFSRFITYVTPDNVAIFSSRGTVNNLGYVYLCNTKGSAYAVGTPSQAGVIVMKRYHGGSWE